MAKRATQQPALPLQQISLDFAFFQALDRFYKDQRGFIRTHYRDLTKKFLDYNDPSHANTFLRQPQFEALEMYVFLKEFLENAHVYEIFQAWGEQTGKFAGRTKQARSGQLDIFGELTKEQYGVLFQRMRAHARPYPNYIYALTMGTGKTILMATCIFYEFLLANKFPADKRYCHNVLVFAPDKTVLQSLREIQTFDKTRVVPPEYVHWLDTNIRFHFLEETGTSLSVIDKSRFNIIISNTQKIILKRQGKPQTAMEQLFGSGKPTYQADSVYAQYQDLYDLAEPQDEESLTTNQRFEKLRRLEQLGIYVDEAHHAFGTKLAQDMGLKQTATSLRLTIDELAASLQRAGTQVVACFNYTGTPYVGHEVLPEVVYAFGLQTAIKDGYLKKVKIHGYTNPRSSEFVQMAIQDFLAANRDQRHEDMRPKLAFFAATIDELQHELRPAVEATLLAEGINPNTILVNVGDEKLTSNDDIREFNRLDTPNSEKQFILLVNKGREGWNCRSLFGVALFRQPKSKIFVLQATMRCLRSIGEGQQTGQVYLSDENIQILNDELQQNFHISREELEGAGQDRHPIEIHVRRNKELTLRRIHKQFDLQEKAVPPGFRLALDQLETDRYRLLHTIQEGLPVKTTTKTTVEDVTAIRVKRSFSPLTLVAEIARYLNKTCLNIEQILNSTQEGMAALVTAVNEYNEILYDWIIPRLFQALYDIQEHTTTEEYKVNLIKMPPTGHYTVTAAPDRVVRYEDATPVNLAHRDKSFHLDAYCFDSLPEQVLFWHLLQEGKINEVFFTGMLTHGQSEFYIQYIDPESHTVRSYYPDFLVQKSDESYVIVEVKGDNKIDDSVVLAKKNFAEQMAVASGMSYHIIKGSDANAGHYQFILKNEPYYQTDRQPQTPLIEGV